MAASFYSSPLIGATTTLACFAHEIPHEIADYSILIRSGFTKRQAMQSQFVTAIGAFVSAAETLYVTRSPVLIHLFLWIERTATRSGKQNPVCFRTGMLITISSGFWIEPHRTFIGIAIHNLSASGGEVTEQSDLVAALKGAAAGILGTTVQMADLVSGAHLLVAYFVFV